MVNTFVWDRLVVALSLVSQIRIAKAKPIFSNSVDTYSSDLLHKNNILYLGTSMLNKIAKNYWTSQRKGMKLFFSNLRDFIFKL